MASPHLKGVKIQSKRIRKESAPSVLASSTAAAACSSTKASRKYSQVQSYSHQQPVMSSSPQVGVEKANASKTQMMPTMQQGQNPNQQWISHSPFDQMPTQVDMPMVQYYPSADQSNNIGEQQQSSQLQLQQSYDGEDLAYRDAISPPMQSQQQPSHYTSIMSPSLLISTNRQQQVSRGVIAPAAVSAGAVSQVPITSQAGPHYERSNTNVPQYHQAINYAGVMPPMYPEGTYAYQPAMMGNAQSIMEERQQVVVVGAKKQQNGSQSFSSNSESQYSSSSSDGQIANHLLLHQQQSQYNNNNNMVVGDVHAPTRGASGRQSAMKTIVVLPPMPPQQSQQQLHIHSQQQQLHANHHQQYSHHHNHQLQQQQLQQQQQWISPVKEYGMIPRGSSLSVGGGNSVRNGSGMKEFGAYQNGMIGGIPQAGGQGTPGSATQKSKQGSGAGMINFSPVMRSSVDAQYHNQQQQQHHHTNPPPSYHNNNNHINNNNKVTISNFSIDNPSSVGGVAASVSATNLPQFNHISPHKQNSKKSSASNHSNSNTGKKNNCSTSNSSNSSTNDVNGKGVTVTVAAAVAVQSNAAAAAAAAGSQASLVLRNWNLLPIEIKQAALSANSIGEVEENFEKLIPEIAIPADAAQAISKIMEAQRMQESLIFALTNTKEGTPLQLAVANRIKAMKLEEETNSSTQADGASSGGAICSSTSATTAGAAAAALVSSPGKNHGSAGGSVAVPATPKMSSGKPIRKASKKIHSSSSATTTANNIIIHASHNQNNNNNNSHQHQVHEKKLQIALSNQKSPSVRIARSQSVVANFSGQQNFAYAQQDANPIYQNITNNSFNFLPEESDKSPVMNEESMRQPIHEMNGFLDEPQLFQNNPGNISPARKHAHSLQGYDEDEEEMDRQADFDEYPYQQTKLRRHMSDPYPDYYYQQNLRQQIPVQQPMIQFNDGIGGGLAPIYEDEGPYYGGVSSNSQHFTAQQQQQSQQLLMQQRAQQLQSSQQLPPILPQQQSQQQSIMMMRQNQQQQQLLVQQQQQQQQQQQLQTGQNLLSEYPSQSNTFTECAIEDMNSSLQTYGPIPQQIAANSLNNSSFFGNPNQNSYANNQGYSGFDAIGMPKSQSQQFFSSSLQQNQQPVQPLLSQRASMESKRKYEFDFEQNSSSLLDIRRP